MSNSIKNCAWDLSIVAEMLGLSSSQRSLFGIFRFNDMAVTADDCIKIKEKWNYGEVLFHLSKSVKNQLIIEY